MTELSVTVEAAGNLALVAVMFAVAGPRAWRGHLRDFTATAYTVGIWALTNVAFAAFYLERRTDALPNWLAYDTPLEEITKGIQIGTMYALPVLLIGNLYRFHK